MQVAEAQRAFTRCLQQTFHQLYHSKATEYDKWATRSRFCVKIGNDDIALFVSCFDIAMGLDNVFQRVTPVDDRL